MIEVKMREFLPRGWTVSIEIVYRRGQGIT
jgi:hypothetical protein